MRLRLFLTIVLANSLALARSESWSESRSESRSESWRVGQDSIWGGLYPLESQSREVRSLDGLWNFRVSPLHDPDTGFREEWYLQPLIENGPVISMAVPSSYNDITQDKQLRDHIGWAWYDRTFFVPLRWQTDKLRVVLRMGSAHYNSIVYVNGLEVTSHSGGHLPFMAELNGVLLFGAENLITVTINNTLTPETIPQGEIVYHDDTTMYPEGYFEQKYSFDFFNYAGIHRPVHIYTTPQTYVEDILVTTTIQGTSGIINYDVTIGGSSSPSQAACSVDVLDKRGMYVTSADGCVGSITLADAQFWWPYLMDPNPGYQYTLKVTVSDESGTLDVYHQKFGIREVSWDSTTLMINGKPVYLTGFGKHEDSNIRGKGVDYPLIVKDFSLIKWLGANSFRTSHYPYAEEIMDMADQEGIMVIDEAPAVNLVGFDEELMNTHISVMQELVRRDKNRPSVIMWSVANEPSSAQPASENYFSTLVTETHQSDPTRPVTAVLNETLEADLAGQSLDIILVNKYFSWYHDTGHTELIKNQTIAAFEGWHALHNKPIMISEYGADAIAGFHTDPSSTWTEDYQADMMMQYFEAFDVLRNEGFFIGEHLWCFADFATAQGVGRPDGNKKGVLTRNRQPKMAAHVLRYRYHSLANSNSANSTLLTGFRFT